MALDTYDNLKTAIANWIIRDDLTSQMDDFIDLAEAMFRFEPRPPDDADIGGVRVAITEQTGTLSTSAATLSKPSDWLAPYRFDLTGENGGRVKYVGPDAMPLHFLEGSGLPKYWTVTNEIEFNVIPDSAYAYSVKYWSNPTALSASNTSNTILTTYPNVYLSACLHHAFQYLQDDQNANLWLTRYKAYAWAATRSFKAQNLTTGSIASKAA